MSYVVPPKWARYWLASVLPIHHFGDWSHGGERRAQRGRRPPCITSCLLKVNFFMMKVSLLFPPRPPPLWISAHFMNIYINIRRNTKRRGIYFISKPFPSVCSIRAVNRTMNFSNQFLKWPCCKSPTSAEASLPSRGNKSSTDTAVLLFAICVIRCRCHEINMSWLYLRSVLQEKPRLTWPRACCRRSRGYTTWRKHEKALFFLDGIIRNGGGRQRAAVVRGWWCVFSLYHGV